MNRSIRQNLILIICSLIVVSIVSSLLLTYSLVSADYEQKMKYTNFTMAGSLADNVSQFMDNANNVNQMLAEYPGIENMDQQTQKKLLEEVVKKYPWLQLLAITSLQGDQIARSSGIGGNRSERPWYKRFMINKENYISSTYYSVTSESPITTIVHGIYSDNELKGMMMADIEISRLQEMVEKYNGGEGSYAYLLDGDGAVIAHPDRRQVADLYNYRTMEKRVLMRDENGRMIKSTTNNEVTQIHPIQIAPSLRPIVMKVMHGDIGTGEYTELNGEEYICAYRSIDLPGKSDKWSLIVVQKKSAVMSVMTGMLLKSSLVGLVVLLLSALITVWFSRKITEPIIEIVEATNQLKDGNLNVVLQVKNNNEIGLLAKNFNQMVCELRENMLEREMSHRKIANIAFHDSLTGLPNRTQLNSYLEDELGRARDGQASGIILFVDLDDFKAINDNFGHSFGDKLLVTVSGNILATIGTGAFVSRLGGDEFVVVIPGSNERSMAADFANKLINTLSQEFDIADEKIHTSASVGVLIYPDDGDMAEDILKKADTAMYAAKKAGRNCWRFYEPILLQEAYETMILTNGLRRGLEKNEFCLYYQPQFTVDGKKIVGFESLIRWNRNELGLVAPDRFIPLAEQSGLILPIGRWVLREACNFARRLSDIGRADICIAVNISPKQLLEDDFVDMVSQSIIGAGIEASQLELEVTESILIQSMEDSVAKLRALRDVGIMVSLDDFGTGYSSLTYLRKLPVGILKIDKSFIDMILNDEMQFQVVGSIVDLAHKIGLTVIAEGVETEEQLQVLALADCDYIQGYVFSRPLIEKDALELLEKY